MTCYLSSHLNGKQHILAAARSPININSHTSSFLMGLLCCSPMGFAWDITAVTLTETTNSLNCRKRWGKPMGKELVKIIHSHVLIPHIRMARRPMPPLVQKKIIVGHYIQVSKTERSRLGRSARWEILKKCANFWQLKLETIKKTSFSTVISNVAKK